jgi:hypothetical protein
MKQSFSFVCENLSHNTQYKTHVNSEINLHKMCFWKEQLFVHFFADMIFGNKVKFSL